MLPQLVGDYNAGEFETLIHLAAPAMLSCCFGETLGVVSMLFIGRLGPDSLSAATLVRNVRLLYELRGNPRVL